MTLALDRTDLKILRELQVDASLTNVELAARVNLSPSPCLARVKTLEQSGVIDRRVAVLDASLLGLAVVAFVEIRLERQEQQTTENFDQLVGRIDEVMDCYRMSGPNDYLLRVVSRDLDELEYIVTNRLARLPGVATIRTNVVLKRVAHKTTLPIDTSRSIQVSVGSRDSGRKAQQPLMR